jgi:hypothetical protein
MGANGQTPALVRPLAAKWLEGRANAGVRPPESKTSRSVARTARLTQGTIAPPPDSTLLFFDYDQAVEIPLT